MTAGDMVIYAVMALLGAAVGWVLRQSGANAREGALKRQVLDAKAAVPQLESSIRNRDQQLATLSGQLDNLKERVQELSETVERQTGEIASRDRKLRDANSELAVLKVGGEGDAALYGDPAEAPKPGDADLVQRVRRAESRYESLKRALIERDDRITALETELKSGSRGPSPEELENLTAELEARDAKLAQLNARLEEEAERREVLESLAKTRSEAKREQREKLASLEQELPTLRTTLAEKETMIQQRVATIAELREQVAALEQGKARAEATVLKLTDALEERGRTIAAHDGLMATMNKTLEAHKTQIETLTQRNGRTDQALSDAEQRLAERDGKIAELEVQQRTAATTVESLRGALSDRDFKVQDLTTEVRRLTEQRDAARTELTAATAGDDRGRLTAELEDLKQREAELRRANTQLEARVKSQDQAPRPTEPAADRTLLERDHRIAALERSLRDARDQLDVLAREKAAAQAALEAREGDRRQTDPTSASRADEGALKTAEQRIRSLENLLKDRDFRIDSLLQDMAALQAKLDVYRDTDANGSDDPVPPEAASQVPPKAAGQVPPTAASQ